MKTFTGPDKTMTEFDIEDIQVQHDHADIDGKRRLYTFLRVSL